MGDKIRQFGGKRFSPIFRGQAPGFSERWTGLIVRPRAFAGGIPGQMYLLWGAEEGIDTYELCRDGKMVATVHREADDGIPLMNVRYEECGLEPGRKYEYRLRPVFRNGQRGEMGTPFYGLTRAKRAQVDNVARRRQALIDMPK